MRHRSKIRGPIVAILLAAGLALVGLIHWNANGRLPRRDVAVGVLLLPDEHFWMREEALYSFVITNGGNGVLLGECHLEVWHSGSWFNARPQPRFAHGTFLILVPGETEEVTCSAPTNRVDSGYASKPGESPGSRWRLVYDFSVSRQPSGLVGQGLEQLLGSLVRRRRQSFGPEIPFAIAPRKE